VQYVWLEINEILYETTRIGKTEKKKKKRKRDQNLVTSPSSRGKKNRAVYI